MAEEQDYDPNKETVQEFVTRRLRVGMEEEIEKWEHSVLHGNNEGGTLKGLFNPENEEEWRTVAEAPNYEVSDQARVRNKKTGRILRATRQGAVGLMRDGERFNRHAKSLRTRAFWEGFVDGRGVAADSRGDQL
jgi:hypothetical protein